MDYCYQCRLPLNGALTCGGCGATAQEPWQPDVTPSGARYGRDATPNDGYGHGFDDGVGPGIDHGEFVVTPAGHGERADEAAAGAEVLGHRRARTASRRRGGPRRARRRRGRRIVIGMIGAVLAVAALSLAQLAIEGSGPHGATSVQEDRAVEYQGGPDALDGPADPSAPGSPTADPVPGGTSGPPSPDANASGTGPGDGSGSGSGEGSGGGNGSGDAGVPAVPGEPVPSASVAPPGPGDPGQPQPASPGPGGPTPGETGPSGSPGPTGEPTATDPAPEGPTPQPEPEPSEEEHCIPILIVFCL